jgi:hypothetical protein
VRASRRVLALLATGACALAAAAPASAITITNLRVSDSGGRTTFSATLVSPPTARSCTALARAMMVATNPDRVIKALGRHKINVCRTGKRGTTYGYMTGYFSTTNIRRPYQYGLCISAEQVLRNGKTSRHYSCKPVYLLY